MTRPMPARIRTDTRSARRPALRRGTQNEHHITSSFVIFVHQFIQACEKITVQGQGHGLRNVERYSFGWLPLNCPRTEHQSTRGATKKEYEPAALQRYLRVEAGERALPDPGERRGRRVVDRGLEARRGHRASTTDAHFCCAKRTTCGECLSFPPLVKGGPGGVGAGASEVVNGRPEHHERVSHPLHGR